MAKSKLVKANQKIEKAVVGSYQKIEDKVVGSYKKIEDKFMKSLKKYTKITVKHNSSLFIWYNIDKKNGDKLC